MNERAPGLEFARAGAVTAVPLAVAVGLFGVSFGVISASDGGIGALPAIVMSITTFAGSAQFAAAAIVGAGGQPIAAIAAALMLNARYLPIGISVARFLRGGVLRRLGLAQLVVDESWAIASRGDGEFDGDRLIGAGIVLWSAWVIGTTVGVVGGEALGDPTVLGLDAAFPALFLALLVPQLRSRKGVAAALLGGAIALALTPFAPVGVPIIAASAASLIGLVRR
jgi:4-azaleucine resistance transporter AzlC